MYKTPGVYIQEKDLLAPTAELLTGVPAFLGLTEKKPTNRPDEPHMLTLWTQFEEEFGTPLPDSYLAYAVRGFFRNVHGFFESSGHRCYVVSVDDVENSLEQGLATLSSLDTIDLICVPDIVKYPKQALNLQQKVLEYCEKAGDRFAILDSLPHADVNEMRTQRQGLEGKNGALYYPWVKELDGPVLTDGLMPPCGHVAGVYARSDRHTGVHKAPANEVLAGVLDLEMHVTQIEQDILNPGGINCLRIFPGRGIRVWGARTLSRDSAWLYVNVRRLFLTAARWIERNLAGVVFEPNDSKLWARIRRELTAYFTNLFRQGALKGQTPQEAFYVKCDEETNPSEVQDAGMVVTEIGLAPALPGEFIVVTLIHGASGITITGPTWSGR